MDIAALSMGLSQMKLGQEVGISVMKLAMDTTKTQSNELAQMLEQAAMPHLGGSIDISL